MSQNVTILIEHGLLPRPLYSRLLLFVLFSNHIHNILQSYLFIFPRGLISLYFTFSNEGTCFLLVR